MMLSILTPSALGARLSDIAAGSIRDMAPRVWRANGMQEGPSRIIADRLMVERLVPVDDDWLRHMVLGDSPATELDWSTVDGALALIGEFDEASLHRVMSTVCGIAAGKPSSAVLSGGASNMAALGVVGVWTGSGSPDLTELAETLVHESAHQAVYIHEYTRPLLKEDAYSTQARVPSAVRAIYGSGQEPLRSVPAAVHAACVATELISLYEWRGDLARALQFRDALSTSLRWLQELPDLFTPAGDTLLAELSHWGS